MKEEVHLSTQRTRQHGEFVGLRQHLLAILIKALIKSANLKNVYIEVVV